MIILKDKTNAWISEEEINSIVKGVKEGLKIYKSSVQSKLVSFEKEYYKIVYDLKKHKLSTQLFSDINSWIGSICFGIQEINFENELDEFNKLCPSIVVSSMLNGENYTKYFITYIEPQYKNKMFISGL